MKELTPRHEQAAALLAAGEMPDGEVARRVGMNPNWLSQLKKRPDFQALVERYQERVVEGTLERVRKNLERDAPRNLRFLTETRDGNFADDEKAMGVRLRASQILFDRQVPKRDEVERGGVTIVINQEAVKRLEKAQVEEVEWSES